MLTLGVRICLGQGDGHSSHYLHGLNSLELTNESLLLAFVKVWVFTLRSIINLTFQQRITQ